jgi:uncharacterized protein
LLISAINYYLVRKYHFVERKMQYRKFGPLDWQVSALGFGAMRLPVLDGDNSKIDRPEAIRMIRYAINQGVNYVDTAYPYHMGTSEGVVGEALKDGYREKVRLATKMPTWKIESYDDFDRFYNEQLDRLQTDVVDFYLLHALNKDIWKKINDFGVLQWAEKAFKDGRIRYLGFSFHDQYPIFKEILDSTDLWTFCQIQYNYMDTNNQAGIKGLKDAAAKGLAVVVMEPLLGGKLANAPAAVQAVWDSALEKRTPADWALQWVWNQPEVTLLLSGMSTMEQVEQNLASASRSGIGNLSSEDLALFDTVKEKYDELCPVPCTGCEYCLPCTSDINIPTMFELLNGARMYGVLDQMRKWYSQIDAEKRADQCTQCLQCEERCPQHITISEWMIVVDEIMGKGKSFENCLPK